MFASFELSTASVSELTGALADHALSVEELVDTAIARIGEQDEAIGAICAPDFDRARAEACKADEARRRGDQRPLLGIPLLVSETLDVAGLPGNQAVHGGYSTAHDAIATTDAVIVERAKREGMIVLGKTRAAPAPLSPQVRGGLFGGPGNPWDLKRTAGGASGGAAAALAAGFAPVGLGSDETGALGIPAHFCGVFAHKPSRALMPTAGAIPSSHLTKSWDESRDTVGPMARSVADLTTMFGVLAGQDENKLGRRFQLRLLPARHYRLADFRVLVLEHHPCCSTAPGVRQAVRNVAKIVERRGATVHRGSSMLPGLPEAARLHMRLLHASLAASLSSEVYEAAQGWAATLETEDQSLAAERLRGIVLNHKDWISADRERALLCARWEELFKHYDVILCPMACATASPRWNGPEGEIFCEEPEHEGIDQLVWSGLAATAGLPSTVIPVDWDDDCLPIGVQIIGPAFEDYTALHFAALLEWELGGFVGPRHR